MLNVLVLCLLNSSIPIPCTKQGLWYKLRGVLLDKTIDISQAWNASYSHSLSIDRDALEQINFTHLCPRWQYDHNQSLLHFQLQESSKDYEGAKDLITVHIYPCNLRKDVLSSFSLSWLQVLTSSRTCFHFLHNPSLRETKRLCRWTERRLRIWQSSLKKDDRGENTGRRFRRALGAASSSLVSSTVTNHSETWSTTPSLGLSPSLLTTVQQSGNLDATTVDSGFTENFGVNAVSTYETAIGAESSRPSLSTLQASLQLPLRTSMLTSAAFLSSADGTVMNVTGSYSTGPPLALTLLYTALPTPSLPTSKTSSSVMSVHQPSTTSAWSVTSSKPALSSSRAASSTAPVSLTGSTRTQAPQTASPPGPVPTNSTSVTPPSIQPEHLLEITLQVNSTVDIFGEEFRTSVADGLLLTFLQALQQNQTRAKRADPIYTVEIYAVSRLGVDSVLVQFAVLEDGKPTSAADVLEILNRLPDLLGTLNENLPFLVTRAPTAVAVSPVAQFAGWLAGVVVLAAICIVLAALLGVFVKKSQKREGEVQNIPKRALTPFRKGRLQAAGEPVSRPRLQDPGTGSSSEIGPGLTTPTTGPAPRSPDPWQPRRAPPRGKRPAPRKKLKRKRRKVNSIRHHQVSPVESSSEESIGDPDTGEATPARQLPQRASNGYDGVEQTLEQHSPPMPAARTGPRFKSTVAPLPLLQPQRLTGHQFSDGEGEEKRQTGMGPNSRGPYRKGDAQLSVHWAPKADVDSDQQRKTEAERLRNKKRLREKQRHTQRDSSPRRHHRQGGRGHHEGRRAKRRSEAAMNRAESDIAAWRRVQAQISSLLETEPGDFNEHFRPMQGALAFPRGPAYLQGYSHAVPLEYAPFGPMLGRAPPFPSARPVQPATSQLANSFGPWAQPWQKAPIPNTRHNAEFLRSLQAPSYPPMFPPPAPPPHPSFYPQPSGLADSLQDAGESSSAGLSRSTETPTTPSSLQPPFNPLLTPGSQNYLQQLMSLGHPQAPRPQGKRKGKKSVARDDDRRPHPQPPDRRAGEAGQQPT
ncbi:hypothetical protein GJAV_G00229540 [Gymnothorax javanicus]|nr:hypothetical protein GJAV_G00229540 [Gymnothorax javanicus]